jgi:hypothetical protein
VHRVSEVRQTKIDTVQPLVPEPSPFEVEIDISCEHGNGPSGSLEHWGSLE